MLRRFRLRRIIGFFVLDWLGTLSTFIASVYLFSLYQKNGNGFSDGILRLIQVPFSEIQQLLGTQTYVSLELLFSIAIIWPIFLLIFNVYVGAHNEGLLQELNNVFRAVLFSVITLAAVLFFNFPETNKQLFLFFMILDFALLLGVRILWYIYRSTSWGQWAPKGPRMLIIGADAIGQNVALEIRKYADISVIPIGFIDNDSCKQGQVIAGLPVLGMLDDVMQVVKDHHVRIAVVALPKEYDALQLDICMQLQEQNIWVYVIPVLFTISFPSVPLDIFGHLPIYDLGDPRLHGHWRGKKRIFDVVVTSLGMLAISPFLALAALLIKLDSPGKILYRQKRIGIKGQIFEMVKFRTMYSNADEVLKKHLIDNPEQRETWERYQKLPKDPRITRVGRILRKFSIDELPQLWNVLKGDMSLVGPRPILTNQIELYGAPFDQYVRVRPGITGMWQISGRNQVSFATRAQWDEYYIRNWSIHMDLRILFSTFWVVVRGSGAY